MGRKVTCVGVLATVLVLGSAGAVSAKLIAHWKLDETSGATASDSSGNDYNGTLLGGATWVAGTIDGALEVNGSNGYVDFGNPPDWPDGREARSLCAWAKTDTVASGWKWIAAYGSPATPQAMFIGLNGSALYGGGYGDDVYINNFWQVGVWHHIALTYDGATARLYADGVEVVSAAKAWDLVLSRAHLGRQVNDAAEFWDGAIDDVRLYDHALTPKEVKALIPPKLKARNPIPADGATGILSPLLQWTAGDTAQWHNVYLGTNPELTETDLVSPKGVSAMYWHVPGLESGVTYYWRIDEIEADGTTVHAGDVWRFTAAPVKAFDPKPASGAKYQELDVTLSWAAGTMAISHDVYFGTDPDAVAAGTAGTFKGNQIVATYTPAGLAAGTSYFWRIDEVRSGGMKVQGDVWSFTTLADIAISDPDLLGWWTLDEQEGARAIDWSGHGLHGSFRGNVRWIEGIVGGALDFDGDGDYVDLGNPTDWPADAEPRSLCAWAKTDSVSAGWKWIAAYGSAGTGTAMFIGLNGASLYGGGYGDDIFVDNFWETDVWHHIALTYDGITARLYADGVEVTSDAKTWNLIRSRAHIGRQVNDLVEFWDGAIDDVRVYGIALTPEQIKEAMRGDPKIAWNPQPKLGATADIREADALSWSAGDGAAQHDVYFGTDKDAVKNADATSPPYQGRQTGTSYPLDGRVEFGGGAYFWRIDEVEADGATVHKGVVWEFTIPGYLLVDEFETYNDDDNRIYDAWIDGYADQSSGSTVGNLVAPFAERVIVHGGKQSMPMDYNNVVPPYLSEAEREFAPLQDWTGYGVDTLSLWFRGDPVAYLQTAPDAFTISAGGNDIWNTADQCRFACKRLNGNGSIVARVDSLVMTDGWAKAGVMIRETLDADAKHAAVVVTPSNGVSFPYRTFTGDVSYQTNLAGLNAPYWVRLTRTNDTFKAEHSANGTTWTALGAEQSISMMGTLYIGLCLTSHNVAATTTAQFSNVTAAGGATGAWQVADIGIDHPGNDPDTLYVTVADSANKSVTLTHPDPAATNLTAWTEWKIPLADLAGVNLSKVETMRIGVGDSQTPTPGGSGRIYLDDIRVVGP